MSFKSFKSTAKTYEAQIKNLVKHALKKANLGTFEDLKDFDCETDYGKRAFWTIGENQYYLRYFADNWRDVGVKFEYILYVDFVCACGGEGCREYPSGLDICCSCRAEKREAERKLKEVKPTED